MFANLEPESFPEWESQSAGQWEEFDLLRSLEFVEGILFGDDVEALYTAWRRLPELLRAQVWREREIAAELYRLMLERWQRIPGLRAIGVARRSRGQMESAGLHVDDLLFEDYLRRRYIVDFWAAIDAGDFDRAERIKSDMVAAYRPDGGPRLAGVLFVVPSLTVLGERLYTVLDLPPFFEPESRVPLTEFGLSPVVPILIEGDEEYVLYGAPRPVTLESGMEVEGRFASGLSERGTLTAVADCTYYANPLLVGAGHVFGNVGDTIWVGGQQVAEVRKADTSLDAAVAELLDVAHPTSNVAPPLGAMPAKPVPPTTGIPVQYTGAASQTQLGQYIDVVYRMTPGGARYQNIGAGSLFEVIVTAQYGDSGALLLTGSGGAQALNPGYARQNQAWANLFNGAMVGMLLAGPKKASAGPRRILFRPILDIGSAFDLDWRAN